ncbi:MAG TPA: trypsin-like peptidase domain-containing protein [Gemmatimonadales bacterium]
MKIAIRVLDGARKGIEGVFSSQLAVGRHPESGLQFDPDRDMEVSSRHAVILQQGDAWFVRDIGSRNGTLVNGHPISGDTKLSDTDQIRFGAKGPRVEIRLVRAGTPDRSPPAVERTPVPTPAGGPSRRRDTAGAAGPAPATYESLTTTPAAPASRAGGSTTQRIRVEVGRQTRRLRWMSASLVVVLAVVVGYFVVDRRQQRMEQERVIQATQARVDSILAASEGAIAALQGQVEGLADALETSRTDVQRLQRDLQTARVSGNAQDVESLRRQLADASDAFHRQQLAAQVDYRAINEANQFAVAMLWADLPGIGVQGGTAFAVTPDGKMITNRHVVAGPEGNLRARRLAIQFTNSTQVYPGRVLLVDRDVDLAVIQVQIPRGTVPTVKQLLGSPDAVRVGDPVAVIGFPLGDDLPMRSSGEANLVRPTFSAGAVSKILPDLLQVDGYSAPGASGSPVLNRDGNVVAILYGAQNGTNGRIVFSVPARFAVELLAQVR